MVQENLPPAKIFQFHEALLKLQKPASHRTKSTKTNAGITSRQFRRDSTGEKPPSDPDLIQHICIGILGDLFYSLGAFANTHEALNNNSQTPHGGVHDFKYRIIAASYCVWTKSPRRLINAKFNGR